MSAVEGIELVLSVSLYNTLFSRAFYFRANLRIHYLCFFFSFADDNFLECMEAANCCHAPYITDEILH